MKGMRYLEILPLALFVIAAGVLVPERGSGQSVLILRSRDDTIENLVSAGFREKFQGGFMELTLEKATGEEVKAIRNQAPGMVVAVGEEAIKHTLVFGNDVPVIFCAVDDSELLGISRRNAYVITNETPPGDQFRSFKEFIPGLKKLGVIFCPDRSGEYIGRAEAEAVEAGIELVARPAAGIRDFPGAVREVVPAVDALWVLNDPEFCTREAFNYLLLIAFENNVPLLASSPKLVKSGAVFAYAPDYRGVGEKAAGLAGRIMRGEWPASDKVSIDIGQAVINQRTSSLLNISLSEDLKSKALLY